VCRRQQERINVVLCFILTASIYGDSDSFCHFEHLNNTRASLNYTESPFICSVLEKNHYIIYVGIPKPGHIWRGALSSLCVLTHPLCVTCYAGWINMVIWYWESDRRPHHFRFSHHLGNFSCAKGE
jgi:hypothetical protein